MQRTSGILREVVAQARTLQYITAQSLQVPLQMLDCVATACARTENKEG